MDCLQNYIGLKNWTYPDTVPESGIFVNILPGINTELVERISPKEAVDFDFWGKIKERCFGIFSNDVILKIQERTDFNDILYQTLNLLPINKTLTPVLAGSEYRGIYTRMPTTKYAQYYIDSIQVYSDQVVTTELKVFDVNDGSELYTQSIELEEGLNTILIDQYFNLKYGVLELFIGVDCSDFNSIETYEDQYVWCDEECDTIDSFNSYYDDLQINPASVTIGDLPIFANIRRYSKGFGVTAVSQIKCSVETFICQNRKQLQQAWLYLLGKEILMEKLASPRLNVFTTSNLENTEYIRLDFEKKYYSNLARAMKVIPIDGESICFSCGDVSAVETRGSMP